MTPATASGVAVPRELLINGADDVHIAQHDTLVSKGRRDTVAELIPYAGHCAPTKLPYVMATITDWLANVFSD
jgi:esterase FrsA